MMNRRTLFKGFAATAAGLLVPEPTRGVIYGDSANAVTVVIPGEALRVGSIDGVPVAPGERWLLVGHSSSKLNGVWSVRAGSWERPKDQGREC
jgi:hypothetical protein